jgi:hypothetical protein
MARLGSSTQSASRGAVVTSRSANTGWSAITRMRARVRPRRFWAICHSLQARSISSAGTATLTAPPPYGRVRQMKGLKPVDSSMTARWASGAASPVNASISSRVLYLRNQSRCCSMSHRVGSSGTTLPT